MRWTFQKIFNNYLTDKNDISYLTFFCEIIIFRLPCLSKWRHEKKCHFFLLKCQNTMLYESIGYGILGLLIVCCSSFFDFFNNSLFWLHLQPCFSMKKSNVMSIKMAPEYHQLLFSHQNTKRNGNQMNMNPSWSFSSTFGINCGFGRNFL